MAQHTPVLEAEIVHLLIEYQPALMVDGTLGLGGHAEAILASSSWPLRYIGFDQDQDALRLARQRLGSNLEYREANFADLKRELAGQSVNAILLDLGVSSLQLDESQRGFSYVANGPLDMRMSQDGDLTAADVANRYSEPELTEIFFKYGEERLSRKIARAIVQDREKVKFTETAQLAGLLYRLYPPALRHKHPHPATRVFQALRIEVNQELKVLEKVLADIPSLLAPGGIVMIISFHSLEDRLVKHAFREWVYAGEGSLLTKKPILPSEEEQSTNPRSRSAKLRIFQKQSVE